MHIQTKLNQSQMRIRTKVKSNAYTDKVKSKNQMRIRTNLNQIKAYTDKS